MTSQSHCLLYTPTASSTETALPSEDQEEEEEGGDPFKKGEVQQGLPRTQDGSQPPSSRRSIKAKIEPFLRTCLDWSVRSHTTYIAALAIEFRVTEFEVNNAQFHEETFKG
jgi:hypothetical protein